MGQVQLVAGQAVEVAFAHHGYTARLCADRAR
ncbi:hypothetical protein CIC12_00360 [Burkholderia sp. SG-MS1]|nr:hypothetical protein [Paraburkholderia sp. SG-MS1]